MIVLGKALTALHEAIRVNQDILSYEEEAGLDRASLVALQAKLKKSTTVLNKWLFVVMTAMVEGWQFAKCLDFYESGISL